MTSVTLWEGQPSPDGALLEEGVECSPDGSGSGSRPEQGLYGHVGFLPQGHSQRPKCGSRISASFTHLLARANGLPLCLFIHTHTLTHARAHSLVDANRNVQESPASLFHSLSQNDKTSLSPESKNRKGDVDYSN